MKFTTNRDSLLRILAVAQEIISSKSLVSILSNVYFKADKNENKVYVKCTNSTFKAITSIAADVEEDGETTVYCDKLTNIVSALPIGDILFESTDLEMTVKPVDKKVKFKLKMLASDKFPVINGFKEDGAIKVEACDFRWLIKQTIFAVSTNTNRYMMTGCYLCKKDNLLTMVATDGNRMSTCNCPVNAEIKAAIIPAKILSIIEKLCDSEGFIEINTSEKEFFFKGFGFELSSSLIDAQYPKWEKVLPEGLDHSITLSKVELADAIKRMMIMSDKEGRIQLDAEQDRVVVSSPEMEMGNFKEELAAKYDGAKIEIAMNVMYLSDVLKVINTDDICIDFKVSDENTVKSAIVIRPADTNADYTHIIMPMH
ncbi:MAG: DNA polymerase III subunit beta [Methanobrevibacter sp.]|nr:DNA polymerase III subunit beta [Methanobrevibacter sp.]MBP5785297.1 DNA polymerase III subunit beta [Methanobrevibacter sp.]